MIKYINVIVLRTLMAKLFSIASKKGQADKFITPVISVVVVIAVAVGMYPVLTNYTDSAAFATIPLVGSLGSTLVPLLYGVLILTAILGFMQYKKSRR